MLRRVAPNNDDASEVADLRATLHATLQNTGILAAFMCALAGQIYTSPPSKPICYGQCMVDAQVVVEWMAMGCFFIAIIQTVVLAADVDGVPDALLAQHLKTSVWLHNMPHLFTHVGLLLMAAGYGFDLNERVGCKYFPFGILAAPCFPAFVLGFFFLVRARRQALSQHGWELGRAWFSTWYDCIEDDGGISRPTRRANMEVHDRTKGGRQDSGNVGVGSAVALRGSAQVAAEDGAS